MPAQYTPSLVRQRPGPCLPCSAYYSQMLPCIVHSTRQLFNEGFALMYPEWLVYVWAQAHQAISIEKKPRLGCKTFIIRLCWFNVVLSNLSQKRDRTSKTEVLKTPSAPQENLPGLLITNREQRTKIKVFKKSKIWKIYKNKRPLESLAFPAKINSISTEILQKCSKLYIISLESLEVSLYVSDNFSKERA